MLATCTGLYMMMRVNDQVRVIQKSLIKRVKFLKEKLTLTKRLIVLFLREIIS